MKLETSGMSTTELIEFINQHHKTSPFAIALESIVEVTELSQALTRALNTWEDAPAWILALSDELLKNLGQEVPQRMQRPEVR